MARHKHEALEAALDRVLKLRAEPKHKVCFRQACMTLAGACW
jgi:hypothetical protein